MSVYEQKPGGHTARRELHDSAAVEMPKRKANGAPPDSQRHYGRLAVCGNSNCVEQNVVVSFVGKEKWNSIRDRFGSAASFRNARVRRSRDDYARA